MLTPQQQQEANGFRDGSMVHRGAPAHRQRLNPVRQMQIVQDAAAHIGPVTGWDPNARHEALAQSFGARFATRSEPQNGSGA